MVDAKGVGAAVLTLLAAVLVGVPSFAHPEGAALGVGAFSDASVQTPHVAARAGTLAPSAEQPSGSRAENLRFPGTRVRTTPAQRRVIDRVVAVSPDSVDTRVIIAPIVRPNATRAEVRLARARGLSVARGVRAAPAFDDRTVVQVMPPKRVPRGVSGRIRIVVTWGAAIPSLEPPTGVTGTAGVGAITVRWQSPSASGAGAPTFYQAYAVAGSSIPSNLSPTSATPTCTSGAPTTCTITALAPGRAYIVAVTAVYSAGRSALAFAPSPVTPTAAPSPETSSATLELPGAPGTPTVVAADQEAQVTWTAPTTGGGSINGYRVTVSTSASGSFTDASGTCAPVTTTGSTDLTCTAGGLTNGVAYYFRVAAVNAAGTGPASSSSAAATPAGVPGAPSAPNATAGDTSSVVTWSAPSTGGSAITGYAVQRSLSGGAFTSQPGCTGLGAVLTCTATGLINGSSVRFRVAAINSAGQGPWSAASSTITPYGVPGTPDRPTAVAGVTSVVVDWNPPSANGSAITGYAVRQKAGAGSFVDVSTSCEEYNLFPSTTQCTLTGLTADTEYFYTVAATNARGPGSQSAASVGVKPIAPSSAPVITSVDEGNTSLTVNYTVTASGGETVWSRHSSDDGVTWSSWSNTSSTAGTASITGLINGTMYEVQLGLAVPPATPSTLVSGTATGRPRTTPGTPTGVTGVANDGYVALSWTAPGADGGAPLLGYVVNVGTSATGPWRSPSGTCASSTMSTSTSTSCEATALDNGTTYFFQVAALNEAGVGSFATSAGVTPIGPPDTPAPPTANGGTTTITVEWVAPATNGSAITGYRVLRATNESGPFAAPTGGPCAAATVNASTSVSCTDNDSLSVSATYYYKVAAISAAGDSLYSDASDGTTLVPVGVVPDITGITPGDRRLSVAFTYGAAASNVSYSLDGGSTWATRAPASSASPLVVTGLANGTTYRVRIRMVTTGGFSDPSDVVPGTPRTTPAAPAAPAGEARSSSVVLTWSAPADDGGAPISGYTVQKSTNGTTYTDQAGCTNLGIDFTCTATGLTPGTAYTFKVAAINAAGTGTYSAASSSITPLAATCATGGTCVIGDTGPGGGIVFYVGDFTLTSTGARMKYLEAPLATWSGSSSDPRSAWSGNTSSSVSTGDAIGTGAKNSANMLAVNATGAAKLATDYRGGGLSDWYLPSKDELYQLHVERGRFPAGSFLDGGYWASSQTSSSRASVVTMNAGARVDRPKSSSQPVRPIRAFAPAG
jgi:hypothetical protein